MFTLNVCVCMPKTLVLYYFIIGYEINLLSPVFRIKGFPN